MTKLVRRCCMILLLLGVSSPRLLFSEVTISPGYEGIPWGSPLAIVQEKFPSLTIRVSESDEDFKDGRIFTKTYDQASLISERRFVFYQGGLAKVVCTYQNQYIGDPIEFIQKFVAKFGNNDDFFDEDRYLDSVPFNMKSFVWNNYNKSKIALRAITYNGQELVVAVYLSLDQLQRYQKSISKEIEF